MAEQYLPLYRKYRPQEFSDLVGQDNLVKAFTNAINTGKIAHAYLFCGPRGTGKTSSARILAKSLNCQNGPTLTPCGKCPSCLDILNGNMLDVIEMDAASNRSVEDAQNIIDKIHYAPVNGRYKIFIIDEVHMISKTAFNALLKTLEEPPENVVFILATTEPQKVLETIISRCQRFDFRRITVDDIVKRLQFISKKENIKISDDALFAIAKNSQGGMRDALALLDQISVLDTDNEITVEKVNEILGKIDNETLFKLSQSIFDKSVDNAVQLVNQVYSKGNEPLQIIENLIQYYRNLSVVKTCKDEKIAAELTLLSNDVINSMKQQAETHSVNEIAQIIERLTYYYKEIKFTNNRYLWLELCFIELASGGQKTETISAKVESTPKVEIKQPDIVEPQKPVETHTSFEDLQEEPIVEPEQKQDIPQPEIQTKSSNSTDDWKSILALIESLPSRSFFNTFAKPIELSSSKVIINFKDENFGKRAKEPQKFDALKKACLKYYNTSTIDIEIKIGANIPAQKSAPEPNKEVSEKKNITQISKPKNEQDLQEVKESPQEVESVEAAEIDTSNIKYENNNEYSDQVKMAIDLFGAKVFD